VQSYGKPHVIFPSLQDELLLVDFNPVFMQIPSVTMAILFMQVQQTMNIAKD
jgi:hypothetical protein